MRIRSLTIEAFRGFQEKRLFNFPDTNIIILHGPNGYGKTSFFDAIEWGLTGSIYRYEEDSERKSYQYIKNHFSKGKSPKVIIELGDESTQLKVTRTQSTGGAESTSSIEVEVGGKVIRDKTAEDVLKKLLVNKEWLERVDVNKSLFLTHLLCQERMNGILRGMKEKDRYHAVSRIFGTEQFIVYREIVHKAKIELEGRIGDFQRKLSSLREDKTDLENRIQELSNRLTEPSETASHSKWQMIIKLFKEEFHSFSFSKEPIEIEVLVQEAQAHSNRLDLERQKIDSIMFRELELGRRALLSLKEKSPLLKQLEYQHHVKNSLKDANSTMEQLEFLITNADEYQNVENKTEQIVSQLNGLSNEADQIRSKADQLFEATNRVAKLEENARISQEYSGLCGAFAMEYPYLQEEPRSAFYESLKEIEQRWTLLKECEREQREDEQAYVLHSTFLEQLVTQDQKHQAFLNHVLQVAIENPELKHCPACGTNGITAEYLQQYTSSLLDNIHPDLATAETKKLELYQIRQLSETKLKVARSKWESVNADFHDLISRWNQQHTALLTQETNLRAKYNELNKQLQQNVQYKDEYKKKAEFMKINVINLDFKNQISSSLHDVKQQIETLKGELVVSSFSEKMLEAQYQEIKQLRDDILLWNRRLTEVGILGADSDEVDWIILEEQLEEKIGLLENLKKENERLQLIVKQLLTIHQNERDFKIFDELQQKKASKLRVIQQVEEGLGTLNTTFKSLKDAELKVPDAVNELTGLVMDQMFDTMRAIFVRINSHPLFTDINYDTDKKYNNNRLFLKVMTDADSSIGMHEANPSYIFSAAQVNATAISFFLAMSLTQSWSPLQFVAMDDPVQSMDDLNVTALIDLIRDLANPEKRSHKQFIISTHDSTFYDLMRRKFRFLNVGIVEYDSYSEVGPTFKQHVIAAQEQRSIDIFTKNTT